ncbi:MAG TPA: peptide deformylase [Chloroflexi bacterium]|nr:peptide deformylase [Chloroflexota bacterium]HBY09073.1 peptide deformylase [Chloroflexota bacterium]
MALREIITVPHPTLRRNARKVTDFGPDLQTLIDDMVETMRVAPGVGLAATQVDVPLQVIVVEFGDEDDETVKPSLYTLVNPEILRPSRETIIGTEGCLSIPNLIGDVERSESITVKALTRRGQPTKIKAHGWLARIFQHEIDHLNGVLFTDRAEQVWQPDTESGQVALAD